MLYVGECEKTEERDFFTKNDKFKCWVSHAGSENNLYLSILPMFEAEKEDRERIVYQTISKYAPTCNSED